MLQWVNILFLNTIVLAGQMQHFVFIHKSQFLEEKNQFCIYHTITNYKEWLCNYLAKRERVFCVRKKKLILLALYNT